MGVRELLSWQPKTRKNVHFGATTHFFSLMSFWLPWQPPTVYTMICCYAYICIIYHYVSVLEINLLLYYVKLCASFQIHGWIQTGFTVQKRSIRVEIGDMPVIPCDLEIWWMTLENNRAPLPCYFKLCASFCTHWWIQTWSYSPETFNLGQNRLSF